MDASTECFLCDPEPSLVYLEKGPFFAMLGLGPIGEGYSLIATREHVASMMDLSPGDAGELEAFTDEVRARLQPIFGPCVITEHGRVAACVEAVTATYEPHCLHAHRLVFPGVAELDVVALAPRWDWEAWSSCFEANERFDWRGQYLYVEAADGVARMARATRPIPRRFFRTLVAALTGAAEAPDWRAEPRHDLVEAARRKLAST